MVNHNTVLENFRIWFSPLKISHCIFVVVFYPPHPHGLLYYFLKARLFFKKLIMIVSKLIFILMSRYKVKNDALPTLGTQSYLSIGHHYDLGPDHMQTVNCTGTH
jgi:hypothetical protein